MVEYITKQKQNIGFEYINFCSLDHSWSAVQRKRLKHLYPDLTFLSNFLLHSNVTRKSSWESAGWNFENQNIYCAQHRFFSACTHPTDDEYTHFSREREGVIFVSCTGWILHIILFKLFDYFFLLLHGLLILIFICPVTSFQFSCFVRESTIIYIFIIILSSRENIVHSSQ